MSSMPATSSRPNRSSAPWILLDTLAPGERMLLLLFREPHPLYRVLRQNGYSHETELVADGTFEILIWR